MNYHNQAYSLVCCIYGHEEGGTIEDMAESLQAAVSVVLLDITDEAKADLYALLADSLTEDTKFISAVITVRGALAKNKRRFPHG